MQPRLEAFAKQLLAVVPAGARILEIGPGTGELAETLAAAGFDVVAIDQERRSSFPTLEKTFEDYDASDLRFDCIVASLVLHHIHDLEGALEKIRSLLTPSGVFAIDDYGWERLDELTARRRWGASWEADLGAWRDDRDDLHRSDVMLVALDTHFTRVTYFDHAYFDDGAGDDAIAFTYIGKAPGAAGMP